MASGQYEDVMKHPGKVDPDYKPRATVEMVMHHAEAMNRNSHHIGVEGPMRERDDRTPAELWFRQVDLDLDSLDNALNHLFQKLQPALAPGYHGPEDGEDCVKADQENSGLVEQLKNISRRINAFEEAVQIVARRVEL